MDLQTIRTEIDSIDDQIVKLFEKRMELSKKVAEFKISTGKKVLDKDREKEKIATLCNLASNDFNRSGIEELFTQILSISRKLQYELIKNKKLFPTFTEIEEINKDDQLKVVYFGVKGSYTEQAMEDYFGTDINSFSAPTFKEVMQAINEGKADYGVLPIENTSTGGITDIYDLLADYDNYIIGEHVIKIEHALLGLSGSDIHNIKTVYSHSQGLMQCSRFLDNYKEIKRMEYPSTAASAKKVFEDQDITQAAIASKRAAEHYGLTVLEESINYNDTNSTRFIIITNRKIYLNNANKISICFELPDESGTLYNMLSHIIYNKLNMTKIESRPLEGRSFEYRFFLDIEGNLKDAGIKNALTGINEEAINLKILGNY